jgi:hypothetical protein
MEVSISDTDAKALGFNSTLKQRIVGLVHTHLGRASVVFVELMDESLGITLKTAKGAICIDRNFTRRIDN